MKTVLFDMDGTLTEPRKPIERQMISFIECLAAQVDVGVVTGSPIEYVVEQLLPGLSSWESGVTEKITFYPCNGTQVYRWDATSGEMTQTYKTTLSDHLSSVGDASVLYTHIVMNLLNLQSHAIKTYRELSVTGHFISFRDSMLNWSIPGREANSDARASFVDLDKLQGIRPHLRKALRTRLDAFGLETMDTALGGSTSIDIYPKGWDKTYVLRHLIDPEDVWFFGDKCQPGGNDHSLYSVLATRNRSFEVASVEDTLLRGMTLLGHLKTFYE